jgi:hypothetical protein
MTTLSPSHLDVIERRFLAMTAGPQPLTLDCAALGCGLPDEELPLDQVRVLLLKRQTSWVTKDAVWQDSSEGHTRHRNRGRRWPPR